MAALTVYLFLSAQVISGMEVTGAGTYIVAGFVAGFSEIPTQARQRTNRFRAGVLHQSATLTKRGKPDDRGAHRPVTSLSCGVPTPDGVASLSFGEAFVVVDDRRSSQQVDALRRYADHGGDLAGGDQRPGRHDRFADHLAVRRAL
ncbi:hypothetical protein ACIBL3_44550 [Kribbella sp. NPDC050124]|uniref:hypothetical protein n=1 Tax=Kribbella sp. NPDC050124 TaxID=3364114 RepID=UPI0037AAD7E9